jgi:putative membrane protein
VTIPVLQPYASTPYCGAPPAPGALLERWNLDPILWLTLGLTLLVYALVTEKQSSNRPAAWRRACLYSGWTIGALALVSPLCALSVSLFSARVAQHMILAAIAAPLLALGLGGLRRAGDGSTAIWAAAAFAGSLWFWHAPAPYDATFSQAWIYWAMHLSIFGAAYWLWAEIFDAARDHTAALLTAALITTLQMGFLGAGITFASHALYRAHALTTAAWGLSPLEDQQLGGVIMWVPAGLIMVLAVMSCLALAMRQSEARTLTRPQF